MGLRWRAHYAINASKYLKLDELELEEVLGAQLRHSQKAESAYFRELSFILRLFYYAAIRFHRHV